MRNRYSALPILLPILAAFAAAPALAQTTNANNGATGPQVQPPTANAAPEAQSAQQSATDDAQFAKDASSGNIAEVKLGELAQRRGDTPAVREFGRWMVIDHTMAENILQGVSKHANMPLATAPTSAQQATMTRLDGLHGAQFDRDYIDAMVKDHRMTIRTFETESQSGQNGQLKNYAGRLLPVLKQHLAEAEDLRKLGNRYTSATPRRPMERVAMQGDTVAGDRAVARLNQSELSRVEKSNQ